MSNTATELARPARDDVIILRPGRPPKNQAPRPALEAKSITFSLPAYAVEQLQELAQRELSSLAQLVRTAVINELRRHGLGNPPADGIWRGNKIPDDNPTL